MREEIDNRWWPYFLGLFNGIAIGLIIALFTIMFSGCHPYPNKNVIKPDKTKATFR